jgi:hypothetical protein
MKSLYFLLATTLLGPIPLVAQNEEFFSEAEIHQALSLGMSDSEASRLTKYMSNDPRVQATLPTFADMGPITTMYSEDFLLLLSLVSAETNRKVERRLLETHLGKELSSEGRARWDQRRAKLRSELVGAGKLKER